MPIPTPPAPAPRAALIAGALAAALQVAAPAAAAPACQGTIYLTFDTGSQSQAELIASTLGRHRVKATFFLANEKTSRGDYSLDPSWAAYWKARVAEGHAFGSHTFDHVYLRRDAAPGAIAVQPQFGANAGKTLHWSARQLCEEIERVDRRFQELTGAKLDPLWRAPGGRVSAASIAAGKACGYAHVGWAKAGFSGDELSSEAYPNPLLLQRALANLRDGDIFVAHMGIWSRRQAWAPANLEPLIVGLQQKGFCFATLREHPDYKPLMKRP
ncbi:peptidoglycan/xylan/chitin deacetylase (PgdA/CDA1 family) [Janthinobacterium sp. CG_23.3]|uniref:polysaccharide deacetylase family protein n=1 Tax=unclassified Janthinobacterium TaxID=2610881 RepID=UPI0003478DAC|nr:MULTISPECIES: polysaccharide deacetylase family protein [unclassified Janthinobacterium]MEC5163966.1 peptidoglycan/xylan/chitin deacetylase (PgdA/CDA1 family) [Janthinobacterium sp. CG_S6]